MRTTYVPLALPADVAALAVDHAGARTIALSVSASAADIAAALTVIDQPAQE